MCLLWVIIISTFVMRKNKQPRFKSKPKFAFVVDGECEYWYIHMLKRNEREIGIDLKPEIPQKKAIKEQFDRVKELSKDYDKVFWIIDLDVVNSETQTKQKGKKTPLQELEEYLKEIESLNAKEERPRITVIINNPCLEFWFLLHFEETSKYFNDCDKAGKQLKKHLPSYEKTQKYFTSQDSDIYLRLKPHLATAIKNAGKIKAFDIKKPYVGIAQMHLFFEQSGIIIN